MNKKNNLKNKERDTEIWKNPKALNNIYKTTTKMMVKKEILQRKQKRENNLDLSFFCYFFSLV
jgi:hypothetical protein